MTSRQSITAFIILLAIFGLIFYLNNLPRKNPLSKLITSASYSFNIRSKNLSSIIESDLSQAENEGDYAVVVQSLTGDNPELYDRNAREIYPAASLYKLFLIAAALEKIETGELKDDDEIKSTKTHLKEVLGFEDFGYEDMDNNLSFTVTELLQRIATISDNNASVMLAEKIGWDTVQAQANKLGATSTTIKSPISTSASDIALFYKKLYQKQVVSAKSSDRIIDLLSQSKINDRIPKQLPQGLKIAHKTGELSKVRHDSGIVFLEGNPYLIVLLSKNLKYEDDGVEVLADISKDIYDYFSTKTGTKH